MGGALVGRGTCKLIFSAGLYLDRSKLNSGSWERLITSSFKGCGGGWGGGWAQVVLNSK